MTSNKHYKVAVEGNIGCGKSTFLEYFESLSPNIEVSLEPIELWNNVKGHKLFVAPVRLIERSLHSGRHCFIEAIRENNQLSDGDMEVLDEYYKFGSNLPFCKLDLIGLPGHLARCNRELLATCMPSLKLIIWPGKISAQNIKWEVIDVMSCTYAARPRFALIVSDSDIVAEKRASQWTIFNNYTIFTRSCYLGAKVTTAQLLFWCLTVMNPSKESPVSTTNVENRSCAVSNHDSCAHCVSSSGLLPQTQGQFSAFCFFTQLRIFKTLRPPASGFSLFLTIGG